METVRRHVFVKGRVQMVGYRYFTREKAFQYGISGWVKNRDDGQVEAVLEGDEDMVREMLASLKEGPRGAKVLGITSKVEPTEGLKGFHITYE